MEPVYEGKAKRMWATDDPQVLRMEFKDDATAFNALKKAKFENKGRLNKAITLLVYRMLGERGVATHLVADVDATSLLVRRVEILLVEVIVRNAAAGSFVKRTGMAEGTRFGQPVVEFSYKSDELGDPLINDDYVREMKLATADECALLRREALVVNEVLGGFFRQAGLDLIDFKIEFGRLPDDRARIVLADEVSPDTCRLWDVATGRKMDKDRFRQDLGNVMEAYAEVLERVGKVS